MTTLSSGDIEALVARELTSIVDLTVRASLAQRLVMPERHLRNWDYSAEDVQYPCWTVVKDSVYDSSIVYSEHGFGPQNPWGLVSQSSLWFGMDSGWFRRLEDAFADSFMGADLPIWDLVGPNGEVVLSSVSLDEAYARRDVLDALLPKPIHHVRYRSSPPGGVS